MANARVKSGRLGTQQDRTLSRGRRGMSLRGRTVPNRPGVMSRHAAARSNSQDSPWRVENSVTPKPRVHETESWWLNLGRAEFRAAAKEELPRMKVSKIGNYVSAIDHAVSRADRES